MLLRVILLSTPTLAGLAWVGCTGCSTGASTELKLDAGIGEAQPSDARPERDGAPPMELFDPRGWSPLPDAPSSCGERVANEPANAIEPLRWSPCPSGRSGCQRTAATWSDAAVGGLDTFEGEPIRRVKNELHLTHTRSRSAGAKLEWYLVVIERLGGAPVFAMGNAPGRTGADCSGYGIAGERGVVVGLPGHSGAVHAWTAPWQNLGTLTPYKAESTSFGPGESTDAPGLKAFGASGVGFFSRASTSAAWDFKSGSIKVPMAGGKPALVGVSAPAGDGALTFASDDGILAQHLGYLAPDGTNTWLVEPPKGRSIAGFGIDRGVTPNELVWIEGTDDGFGISSSEIWTSPLATTPAGIQRRLVAKTPRAQGRLTGIVADRGRAVLLETRTSARLVRLSDGRGWTVDAEPGYAFPQVIGVGDDDVWISDVKDQPQIQNLGAPSGITRLRFDALGEPTLPNGL